MQELRDIYEIACQQGSFPPLGSNPSVTSSFARGIQRLLPGYRFFKTDSGLMGLCPFWASNADIIIVAFGCVMPLILRRTEINRYQMGGKCSINGKMLGEGFLGPLSAGCRIVYMEVDGHPEAVFVDASGVATQLDPRAGPLPSGWSVWYGADCESKIEVENGKLKEHRLRVPIHLHVNNATAGAKRTKKPSPSILPLMVAFSAHLVSVYFCTTKNKRHKASKCDDDDVCLGSPKRARPSKSPNRS